MKIRFYRVKQISKNKFIPQVKRGLISPWEGIEKENYHLWCVEEIQKMRCVDKTLDDARNTIIQYRLIVEIGDQYPKYHKAF